MPMLFVVALPLLPNERVCVCVCPFYFRRKFDVSIENKQEK